MEHYTSWDAVPENLKTRTALKKLGLKPKRGAEPAAIKISVWRSRETLYKLYDMRACVPLVVSEAQRAALAKAQEASLKARTCRECDWVEDLSQDYRGKHYLVDGLCPWCADVANRKHDKAQASEWARGMLGRADVCILDTETTDLSGEVIELAIVDLAGEPLYVGRFNPSVPIAAEAEAVHGISMRDLAEAPTWAEQVDVIREVLRDRLVLIYNAEFDVDVLRRTCRNHCVPTLSMQTKCLMKWYAQYCNEWSDYWGNYRWQPLDGDHSALGDARAALAVLREMAGKAVEVR